MIVFYVFFELWLHRESALCAYVFVSYALWHLHYVLFNDLQSYNFFSD